MQNNTTISSNQRANGAPAPPAVAQQFIASDWKPYSKNTLQGFFNLTLPSGLIIRECSYHERDSKSWVAMPAKPWVKQDGSTSYVTILEFVDKQTQYEFGCLAVAAIEQLLAAQGGAQ
jgi:hypothetical protein